MTRTISPGRPRLVHDAELARMHAAGKTLQQMAEHFGVHHRSISRHLRALGLSKARQTPGKRVTEEWKARVVELFDGGASNIEVARTTGVAYCTVTRHFPGRGWDRTTSGQHANAMRKANRQFARLGVAPLRTDTTRSHAS